MGRDSEAEDLVKSRLDAGDELKASNLSVAVKAEKKARDTVRYGGIRVATR